MRAALFVVMYGLLVLVGCGGGAPIVSSVTQPITPLSDVALSGVVSSGTQPIVGAHVYLFAAGTTGYGQASVSVVSAAETATSDSVGAYVMTDANGKFSLTGDYACSSGQQLYLYALGGNAGPEVNSATGLMAAVGSCPSSSSPAVFATVNEVSTVAAAYAMAGFATNATHVSSSGTALAQVGVANAFANAGNLATLATGVALATTPAGNGMVPQAEVNTLADVLASCVNVSSSCGTLLVTATADGTTAGTKPTDTATAAINIAHHPLANVAPLFALSQTAPVFSPAFAGQIVDFTVGIAFHGGGLGDFYGIGIPIAIDGAGNAWITNKTGNSVTEISSSGVFLSGVNGYTGGGLQMPGGVAIDLSGNAWIANQTGNSASEISSSGSFLSGINGYTGGAFQMPCGIAIDSVGNVWITNYSGNSVTKLSESGSVLSGTTGYVGGGLSYPIGVAPDASGNVWITNNSPSSVTRISSSGSVLSGANGYTGGGLDTPNGIGIDASGDLWISNELGTSVVELSNSGTLLSGAAGYPGGGIFASAGIAIDGSGSAWISDASGITAISNSGTPILTASGLNGTGVPIGIAGEGVAVDGSGDVWKLDNHYAVELIGIATPVVTPLAAGVKNNMLGTRP